MSGYYIYLISSLPMLHFGTKAPFSFERFLEICRGKIPEGAFSILEIASQRGGCSFECAQPTLKKWLAFDTALRNELAKIRAGRKKLDPLKYVRRLAYTEPFIARIAIKAYRNPSVLEAEEVLDRERWRVLDELAAGHYFDIDALIVYAQKLLILERWQRIHEADKSRLLEDTLECKEEGGRRKA